MTLECLSNKRSWFTNGYFFQQNFSCKTKKMSNFKSQGGASEHVKRRFHSIETSLTAFPRSKDASLLLERQHLSVKFTSDSLIRHGIISPGILKLFIIVARIKYSIQQPKYGKHLFIKSSGWYPWLENVDCLRSLKPLEISLARSWHNSLPYFVRFS